MKVSAGAPTQDRDIGVRGLADQLDTVTKERSRTNAYYSSSHWIDCGDCGIYERFAEQESVEDYEKF